MVLGMPAPSINLQDIKDKHDDQIKPCENSVTKTSQVKKKKK
jgi:hypothetical protein